MQGLTPTAAMKKGDDSKLLVWKVIAYLSVLAAVISLRNPLILAGAAVFLLGGLCLLPVSKPGYPPAYRFQFRRNLWRKSLPRLAYALSLGVVTAVVLALSGPGPAWFHFRWGQWQVAISGPGLQAAVVLLLRMSCALLVVTLLVETTGWPGLLHAARRLGVPPLLIGLLGSTVRYIDVLQGEVRRTQTALRCRAFRPDSILRAESARAFGRILGASLLRSLDRAERVHRAMLSRGYHPAGAAPLSATGGTAPTPALELIDVQFAYPGGPPVLKGVTFSLEPGTRLVILGPNGAGKSTLLLHLNGLLLPQQGSVRVFGQPLDRAHARWAKSQVGLVFQDPDDQVVAPTVLEDVAFGPEQFGWRADEISLAASRALASLQITDLAHRAPQELSLGQKRRVALAGVLAMGAPILALDEPTAFLDPAAQMELACILERLHLDGKTVIIATHDVDLAAAWADRILVLKEGEVLAYGTIRLLADDDLLRQAGLRYPWAVALTPADQDPGEFLEEEAKRCTFRTDFWTPRLWSAARR